MTPVGHQKFGPWNPGISSTLPTALKTHVTLLDSENVFESIEEIDELCTFTGLTREKLVTFRPGRLMVHQLLVQICGSYAVSDGNQYEDLGNNFRSMVQTILDKHLSNQIVEVERVHAATRKEMEATVNSCFADQPDVNNRKNDLPRSWIEKLFKPKKKTGFSLAPFEQDQNLIAHWRQRIEESTGVTQECYRAMVNVIGSIMALHGGIRGDQKLQKRLVVNQLCNQIGCQRIGEYLEPLIAVGAAKEGFETLPVQPAPVIINVKGASASGKSTLRPLQRRLTEELGLDWQEFALISPDIFRKFLLEYESLGENFKYAGMCSGEELQIVDEKLDVLMARKARDKQLPHLLIDRFRFDSFATKSSEQGSNLLTRFGSKVFMFYMITPPHSTVERAWSRGLQVGRYKAVDDLLDHNLEAFNGMPQLFFTWALNRDKDVYYEFLDNSVALGQQPRTVAFGDNGKLVILDLEKFIDIKRFQKLDVYADSAEAVYSKSISDFSVLLEWLRECLQKLDSVTICDFSTGKVFARVAFSEELIELDPVTLSESFEDQGFVSAVKTLFDNLSVKKLEALSPPLRLDPAAMTTLGDSG